jgi:hypothetical protein
MKEIHMIFRSLLSLIFVGCALIALQSCGKSDPAPSQTEAQRVTALLTASTWKIQTVTVDGVNQNALFPNFTLTFTGSNYTSTNGGVVWPSLGWAFAGGSTTSLVRGDNLTVNIDNISSTAMTLSLTWDTTTLGGGKVNSVKGKQVFTFGK